MDLYKNDFLSLEADNEDIYILVKKIGYDIRVFHKILESNCRVGISNFLALRNALNEVTGNRVKIGILKTEVDIYVPLDCMRCEIIVNLPQAYIDENKEEVYIKIMDVLSRNNVTRGIDSHLIREGVISGKRLVVAKGKEGFNIKGENKG